MTVPRRVKERRYAKDPVYSSNRATPWIVERVANSYSSYSPCFRTPASRLSKRETQLETTRNLLFKNLSTNPPPPPPRSRSKTTDSLCNRIPPPWKRIEKSWHCPWTRRTWPGKNFDRAFIWARLKSPGSATRSMHRAISTSTRRRGTNRTTRNACSSFEILSVRIYTWERRGGTMEHGSINGSTRTGRKTGAREDHSRINRFSIRGGRVTFGVNRPSFRVTRWKERLPSRHCRTRRSPIRRCFTIVQVKRGTIFRSRATGWFTCKNPRSPGPERFLTLFISRT